MRILFITTRKMYPVSDGGQKGIELHFNLFRDRDDFIAVVMSNVNDDCRDWKEYFPRIDDMLVIKRCHPQIGKNPVKALWQWYISGKPRRAQVVESEDNKKRVMDYIIKNKIETVVLEGPYSAEHIDFKQLKAMGIRIVTVDHNVEYLFQKENLRRFGALKWLEIFRLKHYEREILSKSDLVITVSPHDAGFLSKEFNLKNVKHIPVPLRSKLAQWKESNKPYIVFNGSLNNYINRISMQWFLDAVWKVYAHKHSNVKLKITGGISGCIKEKIEKCYTNIDFTGFLAEDELEQLMTECLFEISPIIYGSGIKLKLLEALAYGIPTIAMRHCFEGAWYDVGKYTPYIVADDAKAFLGAMERLTIDKEYRRKISVQAKVHFNEIYDSKENRESWYEALRNDKIKRDALQ